MQRIKKDNIIEFRPVSENDLDLLRHWDRQPHVIASNPNDEWDWENELIEADWMEKLIAELDGRPIGFVQIMNPSLDETKYWGDIEEGIRAIDIWVGEKDYLGKGYGSEMMSIAISRCFANPGVKAILIDPLASNIRAHLFYERLGFQFVERRLFGEDDCFVFRLDRANWLNPSE